jgi:HEAT repeat protein
MRRSVAHVLAIALLSGGAAAAPKAPAPAKKKPAPAAAPAPMANVPAGTLERLASHDPEQIKAALDDVRAAGKPAAGAAPAIAKLLEQGLPADLTIAALDTLGDLESDAASSAVAWYSVHRTAAVRQAAVRALAKTKGPDAVEALRHALSDGDAVVRGLAATALGTLKAKDSVRDLFTALDHRVSEAAASIGQLCTPQECDELASRLGKVPFDVVTGGIDQVLFRPPSEVDDDQKVKMVGRVRELGTSEANKFLRDAQARWPKGWSMRVKNAIDQGVMATAGAGQ